MHVYSLYEYEWINGVNLSHEKTLIKSFQTRKMAEVQIAAHAKANRPARRRTTTSKKFSPLIENNDFKVNDELITRRDDEPTNPLDVPRYTKCTKNHRRMNGCTHVKH